MNLRALAATIRLHILPCSDLRRRLREAQQLAARLHLGNLHIARTNLQLTRERDAARAELELLRPVVDAAQTWHDAWSAAPFVGVQVHDMASWRASEELCAAVDALPKVPIQRYRGEA